MQGLTHRILGIVSLLMALICLYLALSLGAEKLLSHKLKEKLQAAQIESDPALIRWSGKGLCAYQLKIRSPKHRLQADINSLCAELSINTDWPFIGLSHIAVSGTQVQLTLPPLVPSAQSLAPVQQQANRVWTKVERAVTNSLNSSQKVQQLWQQIQQALYQLNDYELSLHDTTLRLESDVQTVPFIVGFNARLNRRGGTVRFHSAATQQMSTLILSADQVELGSDLVLNLHNLHMPIQWSIASNPQLLTLSKGSKVSFKSNEVFINAQAKLNAKDSTTPQALLSQLSLKLRSNFRLKQLSLSAQFPTVSNLPTSYIQISGQLEMGKLRQFTLNWNDLDLDTNLLKHLNLSRRDWLDSFSLRSQSSAQLKISPQRVQAELELSHADFVLPSLPSLSWPKLTIKGEFNLPSVNANLQEWGFKRLQVSLQGKQAQIIHADVSLITRLMPSGDKFMERLKSLELDLHVEKSSCQALYNLIPSNLLGSIQSTELSGYATPNIKFTAQRNSAQDPLELKLKVKQLLRRCRFEQMTLQPPKRPAVYKNNKVLKINGVEWLNESFTFVIAPEFSGGKKIKVGPESKNFVPYKELPSYIGGAMYLTEETGFWRGGAFSLSLLNRALNTNIREGRFVYGGSTITQQLVKNLFLGRQKTLTRKIREALISARIIDQVSKQRVLELYLNMIEFGPQVFGIQAAAQYYFQKDARNLSPEEAIFLAMLKVSPKRGKRWKKRGYSPKFTWWKSRMVEVFKRLVKEGLVTENRAKNAAPFVLKWSNGSYLGYERLDQ